MILSCKKEILLLLFVHLRKSRGKTWNFVKVLGKSWNFDAKSLGKKEKKEFFESMLLVETMLSVTTGIKIIH